MLKNVVIGALLAIVLLLGATVVRLENFHYASMAGMCSQFNLADPAQRLSQHRCLHDTKTRTSAIWHLYFGIIGD